MRLADLMLNMRKTGFQKVDAIDQNRNRIADGIRNKVMFEVDAAVRTGSTALFTHDPPRNSDNRHLGRDVFDDDGIGAYPRTGADRDGSENFGARSDEYAAFNCGMPFPE